MIYPGIVTATKLETTGTFSAVLDDGRLIDDVYPMSISARMKGGIISPPKRNDKCLVFFDKNGRAYGLFTWVSSADKDNNLTLTPNFPKNLHSEDVWIGSTERNYICLRGVGNIEFVSAPMCYITLSSVQKKITNYCYNYEVWAQGMTLLHKSDTLKGISHQEIYQDQPNSATGNFYDYSIIDALSITKARLTVDKLGVIQLKLGQISVGLQPAAVEIQVNEPSTTKVTIDLLGNVEIKTEMTVMIDGSMIQVGGKGATHPAVRGDMLMTGHLGHTHLYVAPAVPAPGPPVPTGPATPLPPNILSTKVLVA